MMTVAQPSALFGPLFKAVQERGVFPDSKTFADAVPQRAAGDIIADWAAMEAKGETANGALGAFVRDNFIVPQSPVLTAPEASALRDYIVTLWPALTRQPEAAAPGSSLLPLPQPYVVPGGRFRELYYWDSYFTMLGLAASGRQDLVEAMVANFGSLIERYGHIPNGTRSYYLSRSQPPVFYLMAALSQDRTQDARRQRLRLMMAEHAFWMAGEDIILPGGEHRRVVRLADGALLNRYWDDNAAPRDESWREDIELAHLAPGRVPQELWRDIRAAAESGWDFSSRWFGDRRSLATIRTTRLLPIDLNALIFGMEQAIASEATDLGEQEIAAEFTARASARQDAIDRHLWNEAGAFFADYDLDLGKAADLPTAAQGFALFTRVVRRERAAQTAQSLKTLLRAGGLVTTAGETGQQWDAPNGWAPLQWVAIQGLHAYGDHQLARSIGQRWLAMVERHYLATGQLLEKYDVVTCGAGGGGEYGLEIGFGWTNGVTLELLGQQE